MSRKLQDTLRSAVDRLQVDIQVPMPQFQILPIAPSSEPTQFVDMCTRTRKYSMSYVPRRTGATAMLGNCELASVRHS
eukprot:4175677-Amphidinium_carterae.1